MWCNAAARGHVRRVHFRGDALWPGCSENEWAMLVTRVFLRSVRPCIPHADSKSVQKQSINQLIEKMRSLVDFGLSLTAHLLAIVDGFLTSMVTWSCLDRLCKKNPQKMPLQIHPKLLQWIADFHLVSLFFFTVFRSTNEPKPDCLFLCDFWNAPSCIHVSVIGLMANLLPRIFTNDIKRLVNWYLFPRPI